MVSLLTACRESLGAMIKLLCLFLRQKASEMYNFAMQ